MAWSTTALLLFSPLSWFRRPAKTDYEEVLADLAAEIEVTQTNLVQIRARTRRASLILPFWASLIWMVWTAGCYWLGMLGSGGGPVGSDASWLVWGPVVATPVVIFFARRIVKWWYKRVGAAEDKHLKELHRQRREKVDEIKKATRYDHLRKLLEKYDDEGKAGAGAAKQAGGREAQKTPQKGQAQQQQQPQQQQLSPAQLQQQLRQGRGTMPSQPLPSGMRGAAGPQQHFVRPPPPSAPLQRTWLDRVADAVLGADASSSSLGPEQKYALICSQCKRHNGLATREEFDEIQYTCPHCNSFESRRPSSTPISGSPFRSPRGAPATPQGGMPSRGGSSLAAMKKNVDVGDVSTDSPPPASPLGGGGHSDEDSEVVEGKAGGGEASGERSSGSGLSKRATRSGQGMEVD